MHFLSVGFLIGLIVPYLGVHAADEEINKVLQFAAKVSPKLFDNALTIYDQLWCMHATTEEDCANRKDSVEPTDVYWDYRKQCTWCPASADQAAALGIEGMCSVKGYTLKEEETCDLTSEAMSLLVRYGAKDLSLPAYLACLYGGDPKQNADCENCNGNVVDPRWTGAFPINFINHKNTTSLCTVFSSEAEILPDDDDNDDDTTLTSAEETTDEGDTDGDKEPDQALMLTPMMVTVLVAAFTAVVFQGISNQ